MTIVLAVAAGSVAAAAPAMALGPNEQFLNSSGLPVTYTYGKAGWCQDRNNRTWYGEELSCTDTYQAEVAGGGTVTPPDRDADAIRYDANCRTQLKIDGVYQPTVDRINLGSYYYHYSYPTSVVIVYKECSPPTSVNAYAEPDDPSQVLVQWRLIPGASYRVYRDGTQISGTLPVGTTSFRDYGLTQHTSYQYAVRMVRGSILTSPAFTWVTTTTTQISPTWVPGYSGAYYWVTTFATADGYNQNAAVTGQLWAGTSFVYCKAQAGSYQGAYGVNNLWLWTQLDTPSGAYGWVSAYWLANWGDNQAYTDSGGEI